MTYLVSRSITFGSEMELLFITKCKLAFYSYCLYAHIRYGRKYFLWQKIRKDFNKVRALK